MEVKIDVRRSENNMLLFVMENESIVKVFCRQYEANKYAEELRANIAKG